RKSGEEVRFRRDFSRALCGVRLAGAQSEKVARRAASSRRARRIFGRTPKNGGLPRQELPFTAARPPDSHVAQMIDLLIAREPGMAEHHADQDDHVSID